MTDTVKLAAFAALLLLAFVIGLGAGEILGPIDTGSAHPTTAHGAS